MARTARRGVEWPGTRRGAGRGEGRAIIRNAWLSAGFRYRSVHATPNFLLMRTFTSTTSTPTSLLPRRRPCRLMSDEETALMAAATAAAMSRTGGRGADDGQGVSNPREVLCQAVCI